MGKTSTSAKLPQTEANATGHLNETHISGVDTPCGEGVEHHNNDVDPDLVNNEGNELDQTQNEVEQPRKLSTRVTRKRKRTSQNDDSDQKDVLEKSVVPTKKGRPRKVRMDAAQLALASSNTTDNSTKPKKK